MCVFERGSGVEPPEFIQNSRNSIETLWFTIFPQIFTPFGQTQLIFEISDKIFEFTYELYHWEFYF